MNYAIYARDKQTGAINIGEPVLTKEEANELVKLLNQQLPEKEHWAKEVKQ